MDGGISGAMAAILGVFYHGGRKCHAQDRLEYRQGGASLPAVHCGVLRLLATGKISIH